MSAPAETTGRAKARPSRRTERAPSGGWRTIAAKEFADHLGSVRFFVLLIVIGIAAIVPMYFISNDISSSAPQLAGQPAVFLALFVVGSQSVGGVTTVAFAALLVPLVGIAFGFDGINSERSQGTLSRLLAQPIHRDDVVNGKFAAGILVIAVILGALVILVTALGIVRLGIIPSVEELMRVVAWMLATVLYASFWLAFALLLSVVIRGAASAALVGFGSWLALILFGQFLLPVIANTLFPPNTSRDRRRLLRLDDGPAALPPDLARDPLPGHRHRAHEPGDEERPRRGQPRPVRERPGAAAVAPLARPERPPRLAADRDPHRAHGRHVRPRLRRVPPPGGPRLAPVRMPRPAGMRWAGGSHGRHAIDDTGPMSQPATASLAAPTSRLPAAPRALAAVAGAVAALVAVGVGELFAGLVVGIASPVAAVGTAVIDFAPPGSKDLMVTLFGTNDKTALTLIVGGAVLLLGAGIGVLARTRPGVANGAILAVVGVGALASLRLPGASMTLVLLSAALQAGAATLTLSHLLGAALPAGRGEGGLAGRRTFLVQAGVLGGLAIVGGGLGRRMLEGRAQQVTTAATEIPPAVDPAPAPGPDASFAIDGLTPVVVPNEDFYRIDTALITPAVELAGWSLRVHGMVEREVTLTFAELVQLPLVERYVTIACVSNEVGGRLVGNAKWTGVLLSDVLEMAGVQPGATQVVPRSADGWAAGFPTAWLTDPAHPRDALIAVKMNDEPLPAEHGFPARLIVPGLYGYVSATKWLVDIELTTLEAFDAYWVPRGWSKEAPILTQSRIDVPRRRLDRRARPGRRGRRGLGARPRDLEGRGVRRRRRLGAGDARDGDHPGDLGAVEVDLGRDARRPRHRRPGDGRQRRGPDEPGHAAAARRGARLPRDRRQRRVRHARHARRARRALPARRRGGIAGLPVRSRLG